MRRRLLEAAVRKDDIERHPLHPREHIRFDIRERQCAQGIGTREASSNAGREPAGTIWLWDTSAEVGYGTLFSVISEEVFRGGTIL